MYDLSSTYFYQPAINLFDPMRSDRKFIDKMLTFSGYKCAECGRLLASGAECPTHPRVKS